jgi:deoxycytidylate deaminase
LAYRKEEAYLGHFPNAELVIGICSPLGTGYGPVVHYLTNYLEQFRYVTKEVKLSERFDDLLEALGSTRIVDRSKRVQQIESKIQAGNLIRKLTGKPDVLALVAATAISESRDEAEREDGDFKLLPLERTVHVIVSLKRPEEVETLRRLYGSGFFLIGIASTQAERLQYLVDERGFEKEQVENLIDMDTKEGDEWGQRTRDTFFLSDVFVTAADYKDQLRRFIDLIFGNPFETPTVDERSMYAAYGSSFSSGDLARQVGAALVNEDGDLLSVGWNDVPRFGGGLYSSGIGAGRDMDHGYDSNDREKAEMAERIRGGLGLGSELEEAKATFYSSLRSAGFLDITEFHRAVHAEMEALSACGRRGCATKNASLYVTTFPCHNCTKHIINAGVKRVFYIEPYAKSKAFALHADAITDSADVRDKVPFLPFVGIGPRRYLDLFSLTLGTGYSIERKTNVGDKILWKQASAVPRLQMQPISYLDRETLAIGRLNELITREPASE